jgi:hypothetical protein
MSKGKVFTAQEVQAIIAGNKTMFREVIKVQPPTYIKNVNFAGQGTWEWGNSGVYVEEPYQKGQKIFCKESFVKFQPIHYMRYSSGASFSEVFDGEIAYFADGYGTVAEFKKHYMACNNINELAKSNGLEAVETDGDRWKPAKQMKQEQSRLTLQIKEIRVERLADISEEDAIAEGMFFTDYGKNCYGQQEAGWSWKKNKSSSECLGSAYWAFANKWNATHKKPEAKFEANPWVWAIQFEVEND